MDINNWKRYKRSGTFRRRVKKTYESFQTTSAIADNNLVQECSILKSNGSVQIFSEDVVQREEYNASNFTNLDLSEVDILNNSEMEESSENSDEENKDDEFRQNLREWAISSNIPHETLKYLNIVINKRLPNILPADPRTLLNTNYQKITITAVGNGHYWHNGLIAPLKNILEQVSKTPDHISLMINIDGLPLYKSSRQQVWPILCAIFKNREVAPFVIGIYEGNSKPTDLEAYFGAFIAEAKELIENPLKVIKRDGQQINVKINIGPFVCDSPARALIKGTCSFNAKHGCLKCTIVGEYSHASHTVTFSEVDCPKRNDVDFRSKKYGRHHKYDSPLLRLPVDMIDDFVVGDSLHLLDLGVMKRLLVGWRDGNFGIYLTKWRAADITRVSQFLLSCRMPTEIHRSVRGLDVLAHWKGSEFRTFLYYLSFIILKDLLCPDAYYHFLCFFCAVTICSNKSYFLYLRLADEMLKFFVKNYDKYYGKGYVTSNVHNLIHIVDEVKKYGILQNFSAYPFENQLYSIKKLVRQGNKPLNQIARRLLERQNIEKQRTNKKNDKLYPYISQRKSKNGFVSVIHFESFILSSQCNNKWFLSASNHVVEIILVEKSNEEKISIRGYRLKNNIDSFETPMKSSLLNIYKCNVDSIEKVENVYTLADIKSKLVCVQFNGSLYFAPLIHTL